MAEGISLGSVLTRYEQVGLRTKPSKVRDYDAVQDLLGNTLDHNVLRGSCSRYAAIRAEVRRLVAWFDKKFDSEVTRNLVDEKIMKRFLGLGEPNGQAIRAGSQARLSNG